MARACNPTEFTSLHWIHLWCTALLLIGKATSCINGRITTCQLVLLVRLASCIDGEIFPFQSQLCFFRTLHGFTDCNNSLQNALLDPFVCKLVDESISDPRLSQGCTVAAWPMTSGTVCEKQCTLLKNEVN